MRDVVIHTQRPAPPRALRTEPISRLRPASHGEAPRPDGSLYGKGHRKAVPGLGYDSLGKARVTP